MKKLLTGLILTLTVLLLAAGGIMLSRNTKVYADDTGAKAFEILPTMSTQSTAPNRIWVGTFQIVWNELVDNIVKKPVVFKDYDSPTARLLNNREFKKTDISENSYYTKYGTVSPELKREIEKGIKSKFNEKSDILDMFDWSYKPDCLFIYAMLKKDFKFLHPFDKLSPSGFAQNPEPVEYFGINDNSSKKLYKNVEVLFHNSEKDYAVKLHTKGKDEVILYRTDDELTFAKYYNDINKKSKKYKGNKEFDGKDRLRIPDISLYGQTGFEDLEGHLIKGTRITIEKTIETVDFKMNNEGVKLKSEAAMMAKLSAMPYPAGRYFMFDDKFVLFLIEKDQNVPYYAMRISDVKAVNKTGKK